METKDISHLGPPALKIAGFQLWVHSRQFPERTDLWDGNWLNITAHCGAKGANIVISGAILTTMDIERFSTECEKLYKNSQTEALLDPLEPTLQLSLMASDRLGHIQMTVKITPDHLCQKHEVKFGIDQTFLPAIISECRAILETYPVKNIDHK